MNEYTFKVRLRMFSKNVDPDELCERLSLIPTTKWKIGEPRKTPTGQLLDGVYEQSYCTFLMPTESYTEIDAALHRIADSLLLQNDFFYRVQSNGGRIEFYVGWFIDRNAGLILSNGLLQKLTSLHLDLSFDVYSEALSPANVSKKINRKSLRRE